MKRHFPYALLAVTACCQIAGAEPVVLMRGGVAAQRVVVSPDADQRVRAAADELAALLGRIGGADVEVKAGDGKAGIAVGVLDDFPDVHGVDLHLAGGLADRETYVVRSHGAGLYVIGATPLAVEHGVWDLLHALGVRQFFPGRTWEVVPRQNVVQIDIDRIERPDYFARRIWYGYGMWDFARAPYDQWCRRNRTRGGFKLNTGHAYRAIIRNNQAAFDAHPEYLALVDGKRQGYKFCISNPGLRRLVVDDALRQFEEDPDRDSVSVDPSDGGGWCECEPCAEFAGISDRVLTLANQVAAAVTEGHPHRRVGIYAYGFHSPPPTIRVHPNVIVSCATAFLRGGKSLEEVLGGWAAQGATLGIREYYSVNAWDRDLPLRGRGGDIPYLKQSIPDFYNRGARFLTSESGDNWGPHGLGYYLAARMLWDIDEAGRLDHHRDDFVARAFGEAKEPMRRFYRLIDHTRPSHVSTDLIGRMYRALRDARASGASPRVRARLDALVLYTRYVELFDTYRKARGPARQAAYEAVIRHVWRMRETEMVHSKALYRDLDNRDKAITLPDDAQWNVPEDENPWKSSEPFSADQLARFVSEGIASNGLVELDIDPVTFSEHLVPARTLNLPEVPIGAWSRGRGTQSFYTWVESAPGDIRITVTGGLIEHYRDRGNVKIDVHQVGGASETGDRETLVAHDESVPPDGEPREVVLRTKQAGLHRVTVSDGHDMTAIQWPEGTPWTFLSSLEDPMRSAGRWHLYFYVPKGTKKIGLYAGANGRILDPTGATVIDLERTPVDFHAIEVPAGQDGRLWKIHQGSKPVRFLNVPPYLARNGEELLLPREVVERDGQD